MADNTSNDQKPVAAFKQAVVGGAIEYLRSHRLLRAMVGGIGGILFAIGVIAAPLWNVPLLSWLDGHQVATTGLAGGFALLGLWFLSSPKSSRSTASIDATNSDAPSDWVTNLERLSDLKASGSLSAEEFKRAKAKLIS